MIQEFKDEYRWLSNFAPVEIEYDGVVYPSVEHFYVAMKTDKQYVREKISTFPYPAQAKKYGQKMDIVDNWEDIKMTVMEYGLSVKFSQDPYKTLLIETGEQYIQEGNWWGDIYWGVDLNTNEGENNLGKLIMKIRQDLTKK